ncbi:MAG TPA: WbqC family protein [Acidimicrobiia bacterium]|nr:WbqC family protein [Acidimicrobiia bacterium]
MESPRVALMQPAFLPWQGYFGLVAAADVFVLLDDFQFQRHSFHQRNRIRLADGSETWISLPVGHPRDGDFPTLGEAVPVVDAKWRRRLKATLDQSYGRTPHHATVREPLDAWIDAPWASVADMNIAFIQLVSELLGFAPAWRRSSEVGSTGQRSDRVLDLLRRTHARTYLCARGSYEYMAEDALFPVDGIEVVFQEFAPPAYPQRRADEFVSHLSVLDALFEVGAAETRRLVLEGQRAWTPWRAMPAMTAATRADP